MVRGGARSRIERAFHNTIRPNPRAIPAACSHFPLPSPARGATESNVQTPPVAAHPSLLRTHRPRHHSGMLTIPRATVRSLLAVVAMAAATCATGGASMDEVAEQYVRLVLALGNHDPDYVDAYYGPPEWRTDAADDRRSAEQIRADARNLIAELRAVTVASEDSLGVLRKQYLETQLDALAARAGMLGGRRLSFDEESRALYDATAPSFPEEHFADLAGELDVLLPGSGSLPARYRAFRAAYVVPPARLDTVFSAAIAACRARTTRYVDLPESESFVVEYVTDKSWSGYNWYQGDYHSLIQVNTDFPIYIDRAVDLACHEGYPGHHVYNVLLEHHLMRNRGWIEFSVYPLFSPQSLIAEGSANYGIAVAFPGDERLAFERDTLYPLAGLDPATAERYSRVLAIAERLDYAGNEAARRYLNGEIDAAAAAAWLERYALFSPDRAQQRVRFFDQYRSYVINYNLGQDLVREWVEAGIGANPTDEARWRRFSALLASPRLPSGLRP